jgi:predicted DNA-binding transcriptional regulator AlpA
MTELLTAVEVASLLRISKSKVYELANERAQSGDIRTNPLPSLRLGSSVRFRKADVEAWLERLVTR